MENRNGLLVDIALEEANGYAERDAAIALMDRSLPGTKRITLSGDKGYDDRSFVERCRERNVTPHVAQKLHSAIDGRTSGPPRYAISQRKRKTRYRSKEKNQLSAYLVGAAYNLLRIAKLTALTA